MLGQEKAAIPDKITFKGQIVEGKETDRTWMVMFQDNTQELVSSRLVAS